MHSKILIFCSISTIVFTIDAITIQMKPVHERSVHEDVALYENPLLGDKKTTKIHIQNQQRRYNAEKARMQRAMTQRSQTYKAKTMDSYLKAYQEHHEDFQRETERKYSTTKPSVNTNESKNNTDFNEISNTKYIAKSSTQARNKRVHNEKDLFDILNQRNTNQIQNGRLTTSGSEQVVYTLDPNYSPAYGGNSYNFAPAVNGYNPISEQTIQSEDTFSQSSAYKEDVETLNALIGKQPNDQLRGFSNLLKAKGINHKVTLQELTNSNINLKASSLDAKNSNRKKYDYVGPYVDQQYKYVDYANQFLPTKDHTPITENTHDIANTAKPSPIVSYIYSTEAPKAYAASNYYKVEVASKVIDEHPKTDFHYLQPHSDDDSLHYAAKYEFGYRVKDHYSGNDFGHQEVSDGKSAKGSYHVLLPDGRLQKVSYVADPSGYHANVSYQ